MPKIRKWLKKQRFQPVLAIESTVELPRPVSTNVNYATVSEQTLVPADSDLLEQSRTQWHLGDWASLTNLSHNALQHHPDRAKLVLLAAAGQIQNSSFATAHQFIQLAQDWGCTKHMVSQILVGGVYNTLARARLKAGDQQRAMEHFKIAATIANQRINANMLAEIQINRETHAIDAVRAKTAQLRQPQISRIPTPLKPQEGITSYAQNFEDVMLWRALGHTENGFYIDIGAHDPVVDSVSKAFHQRGWRGIHIEPLPQLAAALKIERPNDIIINAVVDSKIATLRYYDVSGSGLSTGKREIATKHQDTGWNVNEIEIPSVTLTDIFLQIDEQQEIHWLKIDVEGMEEEVLSGWGISSRRPWIVVVEATEPNTEIPTWNKWEHHLRQRGYESVYFDGLNKFYLHETRKYLKDLFSTPPNVFDKFIKFKHN